MLASEEIRMQHHPLACGYYALINLCLVRGVEPPTFERLEALQRLCVQYDGDRARVGLGLLPMDQLRLLTALNFPAFCAVGAIPAFMSARNIFDTLLKAGCTVVPSYSWQQADGSLMGHCVVIEEASANGYSVLDGNGGFEEGLMIEFYPQFTDEQAEQIEARKLSHPHGNRRILPFGRTATLSDPFGINSYFLVVYPSIDPRGHSHIAGVS